MTRTAPTAAELALAAEVGRLGLTATPHQLERWRAKRWLAPTDQWTDPATGPLRPNIVHRAAWLALLSRPGRSISWIGWMFWAIDDTEETAALLHRALIRTIQLPLRQARIALTEIPQGDSDAAFDVRQDLAARMLEGRRAIGRDLDGLLRDHAGTAGITLPCSRTVSNPFDTTLIRVGARLLTGGMADVSPENSPRPGAACGPGRPSTSTGSPPPTSPPTKPEPTCAPCPRWRRDCRGWSAPLNGQTHACCARRSAHAPRHPPPS
ncbi:hypothetical protein [Streptomyces murinus]|uniref:hypothetical protein n=1 Tax=Streptomyces murinus TaxID=33900 RepID=UPI003F46EB15